MIIRIKGFDLEIQCLENKSSVLVVQNKAMLRLIVNTFINNYSLEDNEIVILDKDQHLKNTEIQVIDQYFNLDINSKTQISNLYKKIEESFLTNYDMNYQLKEYIFKVTTLLKEELLTFDIDIDINDEISFNDLLKVLKVRFASQTCENSLDYLYLYIDILCEFSNVRLLVLINFESYFSTEEINEIYKYLRYKKMIYLCISSNDCDKINYTDIYTIDEDLMEYHYSSN